MRDHADVRHLHKRALHEELGFIGFGFALLIAGIWAMANLDPGPNESWPLLLVFAGPIVVFLSLVGFYTYLEGIEEDTYFPDPFRRQEDAGRRRWFRRHS